jgi:hypothetical protein
VANTIHSPECRDLADALWPLASKATVKSGYWITTPDGEYQPAHATNNWCGDCGTFMVRHLRRRDPKRRSEYMLDGGWVSEYDTPIACAHCGVRLRCSMLTTGAAEELDYFRDHPPRPGNPDDAYDFHEVLTALEYADERDIWMVEEALVIGRAAVATIPGEARHG